ncbi:MAG: hypothetical protein KKE20_01900 [Nanoarchaeota archaeon]|nr:hypothetical protein [Nanoarchaeota archaeon]
MGTDKNNIDSEYKRIVKEYEEFEGVTDRILKDTSHGFFVPTNLRLLFEFFKKIKLDRYKSFIDLGSGDGRVVMLASLFTRAAGIEGDEKLHKMALEMRKKLGMKAELIHRDYLEHDITGYDAVYMYPDNNISYELNKKLLKEIKGDLLIFTDTFLPEALDVEVVRVDFMKFCICKQKKI